MDSVRTGLMELEDNGYLIREKIRGPDGRMTGTVYTIFEVPRTAQETPITDNPSPENPVTEDLHHNPTSDNPIRSTTENKPSANQYSTLTKSSGLQVTWFYNKSRGFARIHEELTISSDHQMQVFSGVNA